MKITWRKRHSKVFYKKHKKHNSDIRKHNELEERNIKFLLDHNVNFTQVETTATGLDKSIMDSTAPMRTYFLENGIHDYSAQPQGQCYKEFRAACIITPTEMVQTKVSFYRPETKKVTHECGFIR